MSPHGIRQQKQPVWCWHSSTTRWHQIRVQMTYTISGGLLFWRGANSILQPKSFIVLRRSLQLYPKGRSRSKFCAQLELWRWMRNREKRLFLASPRQAYFPLLYEKLQDITSRLVRLQWSLAYTTYVERCKVTKTLWQSPSPTRTWLLPQIKAFCS